MRTAEKRNRADRRACHWGRRRAANEARFITEWRGDPRCSVGVPGVSEVPFGVKRTGGGQQRGAVGHLQRDWGEGRDRAGLTVEVSRRSCKAHSSEICERIRRAGGRALLGHSAITSAEAWLSAGVGEGVVKVKVHAFVVSSIDSVQVAPEMLTEAVIASPDETG
jgi:hypothetical protein